MDYAYAANTTPHAMQRRRLRLARIGNEMNQTSARAREVCVFLGIHRKVQVDRISGDVVYSDKSVNIITDRISPMVSPLHGVASS